MLLERLHHRPILTEAPQNLTALIGTAAFFTCKVLSDLHPHVGWVRGILNDSNLNDFNISDLVKVFVQCMLLGGASLVFPFFLISMSTTTVVPYIVIMFVYLPYFACI